MQVSSYQTDSCLHAGSTFSSVNDSDRNYVIPSLTVSTLCMCGWGGGNGEITQNKFLILQKKERRKAVSQCAPRFHRRERCGWVVGVLVCAGGVSGGYFYSSSSVKSARGMDADWKVNTLLFMSLVAFFETVQSKAKWARCPRSAPLCWQVGGQNNMLDAFQE